MTSKAHSSRRAARVVVLAALSALVVLACGLLAKHVIDRRPGPPLAAVVPSDVALYVEVVDVRRLAAGLARARDVDPKRFEPEAPLERLVRGVARGFDLPLDDARAFAGALSSCAVATRPTGDDPAGVPLLGFVDRVPVERLLSSRRFTPLSATPSSRAYTLARGAAILGEGEPSNVNRALAELSTDGELGAVVWYPRPKILVVGSATTAAAIAGVLEGRQDALTSTSRYATAREQAERAEGVAVVVADSGALSGAVELRPEGTVVSLHGRHPPAGMPDARFAAPTAEITLPARLPVETLAYVAFSSKTGMAGRDAERLLLADLRGSGSAAGVALSDAIVDFVEPLGASVAAVYDAIGDQGVLAVVAASDFPLRAESSASAPQTDTRGAEGLAAVVLQHVRDAATVDAVVRALVQRVAPALPIRTEVVAEHLFVGVGDARLVERSLDAFRTGRGALAGDAAHRRALEPLPRRAHGYVWVDSGRVLEALGKSDASLATRLADATGLGDGWLRTVGPDRATSALAFDYSVEGETWTWRMTAVNPIAALPVVRLATQWQKAESVERGDVGPAVGRAAEPAPRIGVVECDAFLDRLDACVAAMPPERRAAMSAASRETRRDYAELARGAGRNALAPVCRAAAQTLPELCGT